MPHLRTVRILGVLAILFGLLGPLASGAGAVAPSDSAHSPIRPQDQVAVGEAMAGRTRYTVSAAFTPASIRDGGRMSGSMTIDYTNATGTVVTDLQFRLYANDPPYNPGGTVVWDVSQNGESLDTLSRQNGTLLRVRLREPLAPGVAASVSLAFATTLPVLPNRSYGMFGYTPQTGTYALAHWLPLLAAWDPETGWFTGPLSTMGDLIYADTAAFTVTLTTPAGLQVVSSGIESKGGLEAGLQTWHLASGPTRDMTIVIDDDFRRETVTVEGIEVTSWFNPGEDVAGNLAAEVASQAVDYFGYVAGDYPFTTLDIVSMPIGDGALGVEFSQLTYIDAELYADITAEDDREALINVITHEVAHQWWYGLVGNNPMESAFIDEGLSNLFMVDYVYRYVGTDAGSRTMESWVTGIYMDYLYRYGDAVVDQDSDAFTSHRAYGTMVYAKSTLGFAAIRDSIGREAFTAGLVLYVERLRFGIATPEDLREAWETTSGRDLRQIWAYWFEEENGLADFPTIQNG